ncbi:hypothetical protein ABZP36_018491 [Zizania latifolia]
MRSWAEGAVAGTEEEVGALPPRAHRRLPRHRPKRPEARAFSVFDGIALQVCIFSLILKNAASLLTDKDPLKVEADTRLAELIQ